MAGAAAVPTNAAAARPSIQNAVAEAPAGTAPQVDEALRASRRDQLALHGHRLLLSRICFWELRLAVGSIIGGMVVDTLIETKLGLQPISGWPYRGRNGLSRPVLVAVRIAARGIVRLPREAGASEAHGGIDGHADGSTD
mmetsp:Transcript_126553/g.393944  ORF Transcript_126553/g.393944 Transcript_126553/m.393944 type:complete len:140 (+) Transcript_126553:70-489(+)